ncbi:hypothetical protein GALL_488540 [mine drainage metagenome]|uniref:Uncharacterized protein n=1 Tax=mine drainage metagenome TaxID=410659 RepID=A0A1J5PFI9_9ZZZZ
MGLKILGRSKLNRVRGHHRQLHALCQLHIGRHLGLILRSTGTLQLQIKPVDKHP